MAGSGESDRSDLGSTVDRERDVHSPVGPRRRAVLTGAVEGIDDPHAACIEARLVVAPLLRKDVVVGARLGEEVDDQLVGLGVTGVLELPAAGALGEQPGSELDEMLTGLRRDAGCDLVVGLGAGHRNSGVRFSVSARTPSRKSGSFTISSSSAPDSTMAEPTSWWRSV